MTAARDLRPAAADPSQTSPGVAAPAGPSSLDTYDITRPTTGRETWVVAVGSATAEHREHRAEDHEDRARRKLWGDREAGYTDIHAAESARWHRQRARGQRERIQRVQACGGVVLRITCQACGLSHDRAQGCRIGLLCLRCRGGIASEKRAKFMAARKHALAGAGEAGLLNANRRGGRWSEKFMTLTIPHLATHSVTERIEIAWRAWPRFARRLRTFVKPAGPLAHWFRVFEWTAGADGLGHPHFHVWLLSPFLPREEILACWRASLIEAGMPEPALTSLVVDIRAVRDSDGAALELVKYLTKDITDGGVPIAPAVYAEVYRALDGKRVTQASRGFMSGARERVACECGAVGQFRIETIEPPAAEVR